tara:strand:+ start:30 stop:308 length:279 start_codon:yes stop_codon:yes gene_type:complete
MSVENIDLDIDELKEEIKKLKEDLDINIKVRCNLETDIFKLASQIKKLKEENEKLEEQIEKLQKPRRTITCSSCGQTGHNKISKKCPNIIDV